MRNYPFYRSYIGSQPHIFLLFDRADRNTSYGIFNHLVDRQFRACYDEHNGRTDSDAEGIANQILSSALTVFVISANALESSKLRNRINFALSRNKKILCIQLEDKELDYGLGMQLANVPAAKLSRYKNIVGLCDDIVQMELFSQDMRGEDAKVLMKSSRRKTVVFTVLAAIVAISIAAAVPVAIGRISYEGSAIARIDKLDRADYLDISGEKAPTLDHLKGKSIKTLIARNMELADITPIGSVLCEDLDLSGNPRIITLEPLLQINGLKTLKVTQDMAVAIAALRGRNRFQIIITG